jgi:hypothetical protein
MDNRNETSILIGGKSLIAGKSVRGAMVYNPAGETLGDIYDVMIDK